MPKPLIKQTLPCLLFQHYLRSLKEGLDVFESLSLQLFVKGESRFGGLTQDTALHKAAYQCGYQDLSVLLRALIDISTPLYQRPKSLEQLTESYQVVSEKKISQFKNATLKEKIKVSSLMNMFQGMFGEPMVLYNPKDKKGLTAFQDTFALKARLGECLSRRILIGFPKKFKMK